MAKYRKEINDYVVFYDIDGVLTSLRQEMARTGQEGELWSKFDPVAIDLFNKIFFRAARNVSFVCISTWRNGIKGEDTLFSHVFLSMLRSSGFVGHVPAFWWTVNPNLLDFKNRAEEIKYFLGEHEVKDFVIFDDSDFGFDEVLGKKRLIKTNSKEGILTDHVLKALSLTGAWEEFC